MFANVSVLYFFDIYLWQMGRQTSCYQDPCASKTFESFHLQKRHFIWKCIFGATLSKHKVLALSRSNRIAEGGQNYTDEIWHVAVLIYVKVWKQRLRIESGGRNFRKITCHAIDAIHRDNLASGMG
jgi:hypothetical protein